MLRLIVRRKAAVRDGLKVATEVGDTHLSLGEHSHHSQGVDKAHAVSLGKEDLALRAERETVKVMA